MPTILILELRSIEGTRPGGELEAADVLSTMIVDVHRLAEGGNVRFGFDPLSS